MRREGSSIFTGEIDGALLKGRMLNYYFVLYDRNKQQLHRHLDSRSPATVKIIGGAAAGGAESVIGGGSLRGKPRSSKSFMTLGFSLGTGAGRITTNGFLIENQKRVAAAGLALSPFHLLLEFDFWINDRFTASLFGRLQIIEFAHLEGLRFKYRAINSQDGRLELRFGGGYGHIRHTLFLPNAVDTTIEGPFLYTLGLAYDVLFGSKMGLRIAGDFIHLIGPSPSQHFDLTLGFVTDF